MSVNDPVSFELSSELSDVKGTAAHKKDTDHSALLFLVAVPLLFIWFGRESQFSYWYIIAYLLFASFYLLVFYMSAYSLADSVSLQGDVIIARKGDITKTIDCKEIVSADYVSQGRAPKKIVVFTNKVTIAFLPSELFQSTWPRTAMTEIIITKANLQWDK